MHYFSTDGNYGDASQMVVLNTDNWTGEDWALIDEARDWNRPQVALDISIKRQQSRPIVVQ
jgi:hypothetical protein